MTSVILLFVWFLVILLAEKGRAAHPVPSSDISSRPLVDDNATSKQYGIITSSATASGETQNKRRKKKRKRRRKVPSLEQNTTAHHVLPILEEKIKASEPSGKIPKTSSKLSEQQQSGALESRPKPKKPNKTSSTPWVEKYVLSTREKLLPIPREFLADGFNLANLSGVIQDLFGSYADASADHDHVNSSS